MSQNAVSNLAEVARQLANESGIQRHFPIRSVEVRVINPDFFEGAQIHITPQDPRYSPFVVSYFNRDREAVILTDKGKVPEAFAERLRREYALAFPAVDVFVTVREVVPDPTEDLKADSILKYA